MVADEPRVRDAMNRDVATVERNDALALADQVMSLGRIRHLPVVDEEGALAGILTRRDILRGAMASALGFGEHAQRKLLEMTPVKEAMTSDVVTVAPDTPLAEAAATMVKRKLGCLVVVDDGRLVGILTEGTFVELAAKRRL